MLGLPRDGRDSHPASDPVGRAAVPLLDLQPVGGRDVVLASSLWTGDSWASGAGAQDRGGARGGLWEEVLRSGSGWHCRQVRAPVSFMRFVWGGDAFVREGFSRPLSESHLGRLGSPTGKKSGPEEGPRGRGRCRGGPGKLEEPLQKGPDPQGWVPPGPRKVWSREAFSKCGRGADPRCAWPGSLGGRQTCAEGACASASRLGVLSS